MAALRRVLEETPSADAMQLLVSLLVDAADGMLVLDEDGTIVLATPAAERLFGLPPLSMAGTAFGRPAANEGSAMIDVVREGSSHTLEMRSSPTWWSGSEGTIVSLRDVTERLETERSLRNFAAMASHELRTPLTTVVGFTSTMIEHWDDLPDSRKLRYLEIIQNQASRLGRLAEDLLRAARAEAGAVELDVEAVDLREVIARAVQSADVEPEVAIGDDLPLLLGDVDRVEEILINYLGNARKYGSPPYVVEARHRGRSGDVVVRVVDHGPGVNRAFVDSLFTRFARDTDAIGAHDGSGLGLAIVRALARAMHGEAWYEPNPAGGSRFCFSLPVAPGGDA